jgi:TrmH family RNA methyltransferase
VVGQVVLKNLWKNKAKNMINRDNIYIVLKDTIYPGNIGATARAMANFGLKNMALVNPQCEFTEETYSRARIAAPIFENAPIYKNLDELSSELAVLVGTSRRGAYRLHMRTSPRLAVEEIADKYSHVKTGIVFGSENAGLSNEDLEKCAWYITIPTHPDFESLNLSHSVSIIAYELYAFEKSATEDLYKTPAPVDQVEGLFRHMVQFLQAVGFPNRGSEGRVYADLKRVISSADLKLTDVNLMHGFMRYIEYKYLGSWLPRENNDTFQNDTIE